MIPVIDWSAIYLFWQPYGTLYFSCLFVPRLLGGTSKGFQKQENFRVGCGQCWFLPESVYLQNSISSLSSLLFFDLEALYLYTYAVSVKSRLAGILDRCVVVVELLIGLYYLLKLGALNWSPADKKSQNQNVWLQPCGF